MKFDKCRPTFFFIVSRLNEDTVSSLLLTKTMRIENSEKASNVNKLHN